MIVLDTNVVSEAAKPAPHPQALRWLAAQERSLLYITAITQAELLYGAEILPPGMRRTRLLQAAEQMFVKEFPGRILSFDEKAAREFARIAAGRAAAGRPISQFDAMIVAIARSHRAALATRNVGDFVNCGISVINPWMD